MNCQFGCVVIILIMVATAAAVASGFYFMCLSQLVAEYLCGMPTKVDIGVCHHCILALSWRSMKWVSAHCPQHPRPQLHTGPGRDWQIHCMTAEWTDDCWTGGCWPCSLWRHIEVKLHWPSTRRNFPSRGEGKQRGWWLVVVNALVEICSTSTCVERRVLQLNGGEITRFSCISLSVCLVIDTCLPL